MAKTKIWVPRCGKQEMFVEGRIALNIYDVEPSFTSKASSNQTKSQHYTSLGIQVSPSIGYILSKNLGIVGGYHYEVHNEFDYFKVGLLCIF